MKCNKIVYNLWHIKASLGGLKTKLLFKLNVYVCVCVRACTRADVPEGALLEL